ncbi:uncharacterized protein LOC142227037 isoform X2 [Haematobia irritans]|uniref:uncharacterized protein LOC142227037 isoform X2 n=1 Tax=Haematobia irritans TaxID=7368 RepID=UPI003F4FF564
MLWMQSYFFCCSVRLGALITSTIAFLSSSIACIYFFVMGLDALNPILKLFNDDDHFRNHFLVKKFTKMVDGDSEKLLGLFQIYFFSHIASGVIAFYGSLKIKKYYLIPLAIFELFRVIYCLISHILIMTVCKNKLNLGILITATLGGGFVICYNWATIVALYQIINLINSERYKSVYGDDPFHPLIPKTYNPMVIENVRVLITPVSNDIDEQKQRNAQKGFLGNNNVIQPIISVLPANYGQNDETKITGRRSWMKSKWATPSHNPLIQPVGPTNSNRNFNIHDSNYSVDYNNWQWSELAPGVSSRNKRNIYGYDWKY